MAIPVSSDRNMRPLTFMRGRLFSMFLSVLKLKLIPIFTRVPQNTVPLPGLPSDCSWTAKGQWAHGPLRPIGHSECALYFS